MGRPKKSSPYESDEQKASDVIAAMIPKTEPVDIEDMPLNSLGDYMRYNKRARELNKKLKLNRYPIKPCPVELHPMERVVFGRNDQPTNPLPVFVSDHMIHFDRTSPRDRLMPGHTYDLPRYIVEYLSKKGTPVWKWYDNPDGSRETRKESVTPRFSLRTIYKDE